MLMSSLSSKPFSIISIYYSYVLIYPYYVDRALLNVFEL